MSSFGSACFFHVPTDSVSFLRQQRVKQLRPHERKWKYFRERRLLTLDRLWIQKEDVRAPVAGDETPISGGQAPPIVQGSLKRRHLQGMFRDSKYSRI